MEHLWKKVDDASNAHLVNIFEIAREKFGRCFSEWNEYVNLHAHQMEVKGSYKKNNRKAEQLMDEGHECYSNGNYRGAMQRYNECLSYAEPNTVWER